MLGIALSLAAAILFGVSTAMQKYSLKRMKKFSLQVLVRKRIWWLSVTVGLSGILTYMMALRFTQISVVQPMLSISIVIPVLVGWIFFKENLRQRWFPIFLIITGVILLTL